MQPRTLILPALLVTLVLAGFTLLDRPASDPAPAPRIEAADWSIDQVHSKIGFRARHFGISFVRGAFKDYEATLSFDPGDLSTVETSATIQVASIFTDNDRRDNHLRSPDFFSADEYPTMTFVSKGVRNIDGNAFELVGDLTIRDVTKEVVLDAEFLGTANAMNSERAAFEARATVDRMEYGLMWDRVTEAGGLVVSKEIQIVIELEVVKEAS